jgi:hypothetical protein
VCVGCGWVEMGFWNSFFSRSGKGGGGGAYFLSSMFVVFWSVMFRSRRGVHSVWVCVVGRVFPLCMSECFFYSQGFSTINSYAKLNRFSLFLIYLPVGMCVQESKHRCTVSFTTSCTVLLTASAGCHKTYCFGRSKVRMKACKSVKM